MLKRTPLRHSVAKRQKGFPGGSFFLVSRRGWAQSELRLEHDLSHVQNAGPLRVNLHFDLDVDTGWQVEAHKSIDGALGGVQNIDQALVNAHLVLVTRSFVDES